MRRIREGKYIYERPDWPDFHWDIERISGLWSRRGTSRDA
jgi:hypothetical protein